MKSSSLITGSLRLSSSRWQRNTAYKNSNVLEGDLISGSLQWRYRCHNSPTSSWSRRLFCNKKLFNSWLPPTINMTTTSMDMTTTTMTTTLSTTHLLMWVGGRGWSQVAAQARRNQESPAAPVLQIIFHFQSSPLPWVCGCWPTCGKAPRPRKGKMSCFVAEVCGGDEPAVVGVKYLRHILNISFDQKYHSSHKKTIHLIHWLI